MVRRKLWRIDLSAIAAATAFTALVAVVFASISPPTQQVLAQNASALSPEGASAAPPPPAESASPFVAAVEPNTDDGKPIMLLDIGGFDQGNIEDPFINAARGFGNGWAAVQTWPGAEVMDMGAMAKAGLIDRALMLPKAVPDGFDAVRTPLFRFGARYDGAHFAGTWVVEWKGAKTARVGLGCAGDQRQLAAGAGGATGRTEFACKASDPDWSNVRFSGLDAGGLKMVRIFRKSEEGLLKAGAVFRPGFLAYAHGYKVLRALDAEAPNVAAARSVDDLARKAYSGWGANPEINPNHLPMGPPIAALFDMAVAADSALWFNVAGPIGAPPVFGEIAVGGPRQGDGFNGEVKAAAEANAASIIASPEWDKYADEVVRAAVASGYPETRALYIETANEVWNNAHPFWWFRDYFLGIRNWLAAQGPIDGYGSMVGAGYMEARFADALSAALKRAGRKQAVRFVLACQMANPATCEGAINGYKAYFARAGLDPAPYLANAGLSTATYFYNGIGLDGLFKAASYDALTAKWLDAIKTDPEGTAKALTDWYLTADSGGTVPYLVKMRKTNEALAAKAGIAFLGDYEGESHEAAYAPLRDNPAFKDWYFNTWMDGPEGERLTRGWIAALYAENPQAIIANYRGVGHREIQWPWFDGLYGEDTGRRRALKDYLRE